MVKKTHWLYDPKAPLYTGELELLEKTMAKKGTKKTKKKKTSDLAFRIPDHLLRRKMIVR